MEHPSDGGGGPARDPAEVLPDLTAVIPAGGVGTRLWPLSRRSSPKFLHDLTGQGRSLLQATVDRLTPLVGGRMLVVTGAAHAEAVRDQLTGLDEDHLILEPDPRDSMPAIGLAAAVLERRDADAILGSFAADHVIGDEEAFARSVHQAVVAARTGALVTLGIRPTYPATGFGYLKVGPQQALPGAPDLRHVESFVEKPDRARAQAYLEAGEHLWNAGIFVVRAATLLDLLALEHPEMVSILRRIAAEPEQIAHLWSSLERISIDHAVAEPAARRGRVSVVPADLDWDDVGDFASLAAVLARGDTHRGDGHGAQDEHPGLSILGPTQDVISQDTTGLVAARSGRIVVTLGLEDVVVVDTPDALLVTTRSRCQDVRSILSALREHGRDDLT